jgi:hypothetical protein
MGWRPRVEHGLPRGGLGYLGLPICAVFLLLQMKSMVPPPHDPRRRSLPVDPPPVAVVWSVVPVGIWLALGLRADDHDDESIDTVIEEERRWPWYLTSEETIVKVWRISTLTIALGAADLAIAAWRVWFRGEGWL